ncbi:hypothetical protein GCM10009122_38050 [Fulvivirga kasyanovii]|uniref:PD(D/E)XK endonuclease domain-containing protein n=1 Tax=Fulvivirga kasyanovii TaxID=396812 RepID=A0ABW9RPU7_9BACT|nr:hypothetical protein [Fulvivirga kasyanovii]MTI25721.1 hypothetical protein [Fulvivirga kasyanovii]
MSFRDSASYGKRQEYKAIAKLLELGFDVYSTLVDDKGIDCVIRINNRRYLDIQIKARSNTCDLKNRGYFPLLTIREKCDNYFFVLYSEFIDSYWVIPSQDIVFLASQEKTNVSENKKGKNTGKYAVRVVGTKCNPLPQFEKYKNEKGFVLLK